MEEGVYLCLTDLLDQDLTAYEFFQTLSPEVRQDLHRRDDEITTFSELQAQTAALRMPSGGFCE